MVHERIGTIFQQIPRKNLFVSFLGGALEFYDFALFGFLASTFSPLYFPQHDANASLLLGFSIFAIGFLMRPIGGMCFGHIGDRLGRRTALCWSLLGMGIATLSIGLLPTYYVIGLTASIMMLLARMLQGFSAGGELTGGVLFVVEQTHSDRKGFVASLAYMGANSGVFLGSLAGFIFTLPAMPSWAWRVPFIIGGLIAIFGLYIRLNLSETEEFTKVPSSHIQKFPLFEAFKQIPMNIICAVVVTSFIGVIYYATFMYFPILLQEYLLLSDSVAKLYGTISTVAMVIMLPVIGFFSDIINKGFITQLGIGLSLIISMLIIWQLYVLPVWIIIAGQILLGVCIASLLASFYVFLSSILQTQIRYSSFAFIDNIGMVVGGFTPFISTLLAQKYGIFAFGFYIFIWGALALIGVSYLTNYPYVNKYSLNYKESSKYV